MFLVNKEVREEIYKLLPSDMTIDQAAIWADYSKFTKDYEWSEPLHYINPINEFPPMTCSKSIRPSLGDLNVVDGIAYYASVLKDKKSSEEQKKEAILFVLHLVGDIHQPLHTSGRDTGGNDIKVNFQGYSIDLHQLWDSFIITVNLIDEII